MGQMIDKSKLISRLLFIAVIIVASAFVIDSLSLNTTLPSKPDIPDDPIITEIEPHKEKLAHGALGDSTGCAECHSEPITSGSCTSTECHPNPPIEIGPDGSIDFPHHDLTFDCAISACHDCSGDFRYVATPSASHGYCGTNDCHDDITHS